MPLHMTKIAFQSESAATLRAWLESHAQEGAPDGAGGEARLTTRYLPKRHAEMAGGSLYWILAHQIIGRSPLLGFAERPDGRHWIRLAPRLIPVFPRFCRRLALSDGLSAPRLADCVEPGQHVLAQRQISRSEIFPQMRDR